MEKGRIKIENFFENCTCPHLTFVTGGGERFEIQMICIMQTPRSMARRLFVTQTFSDKDCLQCRPCYSGHFV